jgi:hypothetical protein
MVAAFLEPVVLVEIATEPEVAAKIHPLQMKLRGSDPASKAGELVKKNCPALEAGSGRGRACPLRCPLFMTSCDPFSFFPREIKNCNWSFSFEQIMFWLLVCQIVDFFFSRVLFLALFFPVCRS